MADTSQNNSWVESYLEALLSYGLSTEYSNKPTSEGKEKVDADRDVFAKYYVNQILEMGEEGIRDAWHKATSTRHYTEQDARLEYLAWRTWFMKRNKQRVTAEAKRFAHHEFMHEDTIMEHDESTSGDEDIVTPKATGADASGLESVKEGAEEARPAGCKPAPAAAEAAGSSEGKVEANEEVPQRAPSMKPPAPRKSLDFRRQESMLIGSVAPINAEDYGSGDLDKTFARSKSLRIETRPTRALEALGINAEDIMQQDEETGPADPFEGRVEGLYIVLISLHGLVRGQHMELGKDADTGGQVKYVVELARAISLHPAVHRVELLTRLIADPKVSKDYSQPEECLLAGDGDCGGAYIVRLPCGDSTDYLRKEKLWPHTREFADRAIAHVSNMLKKLQEVGEPCSLYTVHGHYADAGEVAALVASTMASTEEVDMVMTGHSLGRNKLEHLMASGTMAKAEIEQSYKISRRIEGEERGLDYATMVFTSTQQEVAEQWGLYDGYDPRLEKVLRYRRRTGRHMPIMNVIPPGLDFSNLKVDLPEDPNLKDFTGSKPAFASGKCGTPRKSADSPRTSKDGKQAADKAADEAADAGFIPQPLERAEGSGSFTKQRPPLGGRGLVHSDSTVQMQFHMADKMEENPRIWQEISRFLRHPRKPAILAMSRPDAKKNITTLVKAFGQNPMLRELSNLVLVMGNRDNIDSMAQGSQKVLGQVLKLIDLYDLYGSVAYPKAHSQNDISDIYRYPLVTRGIFVNPALQEPFGLTVIEAAAHGVPTVATKNGGPVDIMATLHHGVVVDPTNEKELGDALLNILTHPSTWQEMSKNGVKNIHAYSWLAHSRKYLESVEREKRHSHAAKKTARASGTWDHKSLGIKEGGRRPSIAGSPKSGGEPGTEVKESHNAEEKLNAGDDVRGASRDAFLVVVMDNQHRAPQAAAQVKQALAVKSAAGDANAGVGIVAMNSFDDTSAWLKKEGVDINEVDWVVAHGGADIRHASAEGGSWTADDAWEEHIDWRWERSSLGKLLSKVSVAEMERAGSSKRLPLLANVNSTDLAVASDSGGGGSGSRIHPHHIVMELDEKAKSALGAKGSGLPPTTVVDRLRKRLRMNGYRCHLTLQMVPGKAGWISAAQLQSCVHVTPVRASRALALRYLAHRFGVPLDRFVVTVPAPTAREEEGDKLLVGSHCSDLQELIGGQPWILVRIPAAADATADEGKLSGADKVAMERMQVKLSKKMFGERVRWAPADDSASLEELVKNLPQSDGEGTQGTGQEAKEGL